jgi:uncharacterized repeat protein (TIGR03847 family)
MPTIVHEFVWPDRLVVGTVGRPGSREFYLQARARARIVTVALEKEQSAALAVKIDRVLDGLRATEGNPFSIPDVTPVELVDNDPLEQPLDTQFRTGALGLGWDPTTAQIVIEAYAMVDIDDVDPDDLGAEPIEVEPPEALLVRIPVGTARAFAKRTLEVVGAGRPLCGICGNPIDPEGHMCAEPSGLG